jgi:PAS domain S-box-containing protein
VLFNAAALDLLGVTEAEIMGRDEHAWDVIGADGAPVRAEDLPLMRALRAGDVIRAVELGVLRPRYGDRVWLLATAQPRFDPAGQVVQVVVTSTDITAQRLALEARSRSEASLAEAQAIAHLGSWETDLTTGESRWSDETFRILGMEPGDCRPSPEAFAVAMRDDDRHTLQMTLDRALHTGEPYQIEHRITRRGSDDRIVDVRGRVERAAAGNPVRMTGTVQDVTRRRRAEDALRETNDTLTSLLASAPTAIVATDRNGLVTAWNPAAERIFGWTPEEVLGKPVPFILKDDRLAFRGRLETLMSGQVLLNMEGRRLRKDGGVVNVVFSGAPLRSATGEVVGVIVALEDVTARVRAADALRQSNEALASLVSSAPAAIIVLDRDRNVTEWNPAAERIFGWTRDDVLGKRPPNILDADRDAYDARMKAVLSGSTFVNAEGRRRTKDGALVEGTFSAAPVRDAAGDIVALMAVFVDLTEQTRARQALRRSDERYHRLIETANEGVWVVDARMKTTYVNGRMADMLGYAPAEIMGRPLLQFVHETSAADARRAFGRRSVSNLQTDLRFSANDGRDVWAIVSTTALTEPDGRFTGVLGMCTDVTERRRAEYELLRENDFRNRVLETAHDAIFALDLDGRFTLVNRRASEISGYDPDELLGQPASRLFDQLARAHLAGAVEREVGAEPREVDLLRKDGQRRTVRVSLEPLYEGARCVGFAGAAEDVTEPRKMEQQFLQAQKMESVGRLAGGVAHDFNNLMTAIIGYADLTLMALPPVAPSRPDIEEIRNTADRAARLAHQLLSFSRRQLIAPEVVNLNELILNTDGLLRRLIGEDIELVTLPAPTLGSVRVDPSQFEQVLVNLVVNARDAMPLGGCLRVETANVTSGEVDGGRRVTDDGAPEGSYVVLSVSDNGIGMTPEVRKHLFEPFFTTKETGKGTGLGLATCYGIVKQAGGEIGVETEPGSGTTFRIYLPRLEDAVADTGGDNAQQDLPRGSETILLAEDEGSVRQVALRTLRALGYRVLEASHGEEAVRLADAHAGRIDLLLTDVVMPQMGGKELADRLLVARPDIRVLFTSGYTDDAMVRHGVSENQLEFIAKPFTPLSLARKVRSVLDQRSVRA